MAFTGTQVLGTKGFLFGTDSRETAGHSINIVGKGLGYVGLAEMSVIVQYVLIGGDLINI